MVTKKKIGFVFKDGTLFCGFCTPGGEMAISIKQGAALGTKLSDERALAFVREVPTWAPDGEEIFVWNPDWAVFKSLPEETQS